MPDDLRPKERVQASENWPLRLAGKQRKFLLPVPLAN